MNFRNRTSKNIKNSLTHTKNNYITTTLGSSFFFSKSSQIHTHTHTHTTDETKFLKPKKCIYYIINDFSLL